MDINFELYKVFYYVANSLSFSEASKHLYISQSAVSQSIKTLEKKLDQQLFVRSTKKVTLTPAGEILLKHIAPAVNLIQRGENQLSASQSFGQLHICASDTICRYFLVPYLKQFHIQFPGVPIKVTNATSLHAADLLEEGLVDIAVSNYPNSKLNQSYITKYVKYFRDVFIANINYFDFTTQELSLRDLQTYPLLMLSRNSTTSEYLKKIFIQNQLELIPDIELNSNDLLIDLANIGLGIACIPDYCLTNHPQEIYTLRIKEEIPMRTIAVAVNPGLPLSASAQAFLELLPEAD